MRRLFFILSFLILAVQGTGIWYYQKYYWTLALTFPFILLGVYEVIQVKRTLMRNYPLAGRLRYVMEVLRPKIYQYFVESDTDGTPVNRIFRSVVYQRAKEQLSTTPFGTQLDVYAPGYEWISHSMNPLTHDQVPPESLRVEVGGPQCAKPYSLSILNISAMSYGSLSSHAIEALNGGAKRGNFAHNTGEGSISDFHKKHGGDLIWQIGTGYFGCRKPEGGFSESEFAKNSNQACVKMIEIKLSQGAKPGHGGILPAKKNTPLIAKARGVKPWTTVDSPPGHSAFSDSKGLLEFVAKLRELSGGKPVGFKLCVGRPSEFEDVCKAMIDTGIKPDFITVDGGEGGTGAAPPEFSNSIGMALKDGLITVVDLLSAYDLRKDIKILCSGKVMTGFDIIRNISLGADACYSARAMMFALGCIQALECNSNHCPTGIATQNPELYKGLDIEDKTNRVANYHKHTVEAVAEILAAAGIDSTTKLNRSHIWRRISETEIKCYDSIHPDRKIGSSLLKTENAVG